MQTWKLWQVLRKPPAAHPLFLYIHSSAVAAVNPRLVIWFGPLMLAGLILYVLLGTWLLPRVTLPLLFSPLPGTTAVLAVFSGTFYGAAWLVTISRTLARQAGHGLYDLLWLSPSGALPAILALGTGCLHRNHSFQVVNDQRQALLNVILTTPGAAVLALFVTAFSGQPDLTEFIMLVIVGSVAVAAAFRLDHMQSIVLGSMLGMIFPLVARERGSNPLLGMIVFLLLQLASYTLLILLTFVLLPYWLRQTGLDGWYTDPLALLLGVVSFYSLRESAIQVCWRVLLRLLDADSEDLRLMERFIRYSDEI